MEQLEHWITQFAPLPLECDGMTRVISTLMQRDGIEHRVCIGSLSVDGIGHIPLHWWIVLPDERTCDLRARMWLGDDPSVPHGLFPPEIGHDYSVDHELLPEQVKLSPVIFAVLAGSPMSTFAAPENYETPDHGYDMP